jgi:ketosteroid isomerase-like protein
MKKFKSTIFLIFIVTLTIYSCSSNKTTLNSKYKAEVMKAEKDFETLVTEKGIAEGFYQFADLNAIIKREHDTLIIGKNNIRNYYSNTKFKNVSVKWAPDYIEVSKKGDMAYTYGKYIWTSKDSEGKEHFSKGIFHTVWKRQKDNSWKYTWD